MHLSISAASLALLSSVLAMPSSELHTRQNQQPAQQPIVLPASTLPTPQSLSPAVTLKFVTIGIGHQNYTCTAGQPVALGATAALYDTKAITQHMPQLAPFLPGRLVKLSPPPRDTTPAAELASPASRARDDADYRPAASNSPPVLGSKPVGWHYFNIEDKLPVFTLPELRANIVGKRIANIPAPATAAKGPDGQAAVDWLLLGDSGQGKSFGGISHVYRVQTAGGGSAGICAGVDGGSVVRVPYATEYWFYGPQ